VSGWDVVTAWTEHAGVPVEVIPTDDAHAEHALDTLEISTRSPLGAIVRNSAGVSVDHGWLRVLGAGGSPRLQEGVNEWSERAGLLIVAHDVAGGFFSWDEERGVLYHAPDTREAEELGGRAYSPWLEGMLTGNLAKFYASERWPGWEAITQALTGDEGLRDRQSVPMATLWEDLHRGS
jgi:hypothetical protein